MRTRLAGGVPAEELTLKTLLDVYLASFSKEANTWHTAEIHTGHLWRLLDVNLTLAAMSKKTVPGYVNARTRKTGHRKRLVRRPTVRKEPGTFSSIWNKWALPRA